MGEEKGISLAPGRFVACLRILSSWLVLLNKEKERLLAGHLVTSYRIILLLSKRGSLFSLQSNRPYKHLYNRNTSLLWTAVLVPEIPISILMDTTVSVMHTPESVFLMSVFGKCNCTILKCKESSQHCHFKLG